MKSENENFFAEQNSLLKYHAKIKLESKKIASSLKNGSFRSIQNGRGIEFSGVREYFFGDDIRLIDSNVSARFSKPFVKLFEEECEVPIFVILDFSLSMKIGENCFGKKTSAKIFSAFEIASLLIFAAEKNCAPIGSLLFDSQIRFFSKPSRKKSNADFLFFSLVEKIFKSQKNIKPKKSSQKNFGTSLCDSILVAEKNLKKKSLIFIISDFRVLDFENSLSHLCAKNDVVAILPKNFYDCEFYNFGTNNFFDVESGAQRNFPSAFRKFKIFWKNQNDVREKKLQKKITKCGADFLFVSGEENFCFALNNFFSERKKR